MAISDLLHFILRFTPSSDSWRYSILKDEEPPVCFADLFDPAGGGCEGSREIAPERHRATPTADRYAGETKQNAEVTAKKQAACKASSPRLSRAARKVKFTVDRQPPLRDFAQRTRSRSVARAYAFPLLGSSPPCRRRRRCKIRGMQKFRRYRRKRPRRDSASAGIST